MKGFMKFSKRSWYFWRYMAIHATFEIELEIHYEQKSNPDDIGWLGKITGP